MRHWILAAASLVVLRAATDSPDRSRLVRAYGQLPLRFEENRGQADSRVKFRSRGNKYTLLFTSNEAQLAFQAKEGESILHLQLMGANAAARVMGLDELPGKSNYLLGSNPKQWHTNLRTFARVKYEAVYPGVDLVYYGNQDQLEYDFIVAPEADPGRIALDLVADGSLTAPRIDSNGDLTVKVGGGELRFHKPVVYQPSGQQRAVVDGRFTLRGNRVGFEIAAYDRGKPLVIDPAIAYSTYLGGSTNVSSGSAIAVLTDPVTGHAYAYVAGGTCASDFPKVNAWQPSFRGGCTVFVTKFDPSASGAASVIYSTYLGGSGGEGASGIAVDSAGNTYITGATSSTDFPTLNAYQAAIKFGPLCSRCATGAQDAFLAKLSADGSRLLYSTYFGGSGGESANAIALDSAGRAYFAGQTSSTDLPTLNPYQSTLRGYGNAFLATFDTTRSGSASLLYSSYLGGSTSHYPYQDSALAVAVDSTGAIHLGGSTNSSDFPVVNAFQTGLFGTATGAAFYTKLNPLASGASQLVYSTFLGGGGNFAGWNVDSVRGIALDLAGNAYLAGTAGSGVFPVTAGAYQTTLLSIPSPFVAKIKPSLTGSASLVYSTFLSGLDAAADVNRLPAASGITVDASGNAFVVGNSGPSIPLVNPARGSSNGVMQSIDGGASWTVLGQGLPGAFIDALAVDTSTSPRTLYAGYEGNGTVGVFRSIDGGLNWQQVFQVPNSSPGITCNTSNDYYSFNHPCLSALAVDPTAPSNVYAGTSAGVFTSPDRGATWSALNTGLSSTALQSVGGLVFDNDGTLFAAAGDGLYRLSAGATTWTRLNSLQDLHIIAIDPTTGPHTIYTASGVFGGPPCASAHESNCIGGFRSTDGGATWISINDQFLAGGQISSFGVDTSTNPATLYAYDATLGEQQSGGPPFWTSTDRGNTWNPLPDPAVVGVDTLSQGGFVPTLYVDKTSRPSILYVRDSDTGGLSKFVVGGNSWTSVLDTPLGSLAVDTTTSPITLYAGTSFPVTDAFVAELNPSGSALLFSTYLGGIDFDTFGNGIALDGSDNIYVAGRMSGPNNIPFPTVNEFPTVRAFQTTISGSGASAFFTQIGSQTLPANSPGSSATQVGVQTGTLTITFPNITGSTTSTAPTLTVTPLSSATTANFSLSNNLGAYDISTTATFSASSANPVTLCFQALTVNDLSTFNGLQIMHVVNGVPQNVTTSYNFSPRTICGAVASLSPFVLVKGPVGQLNDLVRMVTESDVKHGIQTSLDAKLQAASSALSDAKTNAYTTACNVMGAFISDVQAQTGKHITQQEANTFIAAARQVQATIGCTQ